MTRILTDVLRKYRGWVVFSLLVLMLVGLVLASREAWVPGSVAFVMGAVGLGAIGMVLLIPTISPYLGIPCPDDMLSFSKWSQRWFAFVSIAVSVSMVVVAFAIHEAGVSRCVVLIMGLIIGLAGAGLIDIQVDQGDVPKPDAWVGLGLMIMAMGAIGAFQDGESLAGSTTIDYQSLGVLAVFLGFPLVKIGLPGLLDLRPGWIRRVRVAAWILIACGLVLFAALGPNPLPLWVIGVSLTLTSFGYALLVEDGLRFWFTDSGRQSSQGLKTLGSFGAAMVALGVILTLASLDTWQSLVIHLIVIAFAIGAFFALRGEAALFVLLVGFVLLWVSFDRTEGPQDFNPPEAKLVVGLGDSYMAGQGGHDFYDHNNSKTLGPEGTDCRRSPDALPGALAAQLGPEWGSINLACSGAKTVDIWHKAQHSVDGKPPEFLPGARSQLDDLRRLDASVRAKIDHVVVAIGGNDSGFATVIKACLLPADCSDQVRALEADLATNLSGLTETYEEIADAVPERSDGSRPTVAVIPYPEFLSQKECGLTMSADERDAVLSFQRALNREVFEAVAQVERVEVFEAGVDAYDGGLKLCDNGFQVDDAGANFLYLMPHDPPAGLNPAAWVQGSMHPRAAGHKAMAADLAPWLLTNPTGTGADPSPSIESLTGIPALTDMEDWQERELAITLGRVALAFILMMGGGLAISLWLYHRHGKGLAEDHPFKPFFPNPDRP